MQYVNESKDTVSTSRLTDSLLSHLHLHVLSADLCSEKMKNKKHYNSFHPKHGFFLHMDDVLSWFDAEPSYFKTVRLLASLSPIAVIEVFVFVDGSS